MTIPTESAACPICDAATSSEFLLQRSPLLQNVLYEDQASARAAERGNCPIHYCHTCHFAFNPEFLAARIRYDSRYDNDQSASAVYRHFLDELAGRLIGTCGLDRHSRVLEIACGNGYLLSRIGEMCGAEMLGYDPAYSRRYGSREFIKAEPFTAATSFRPDLVILRHCMDSFTNPDAVLRSIIPMLQRDSIVYIESANLDYILGSNDFSLFYHECPRYFSVSSLCRYLSQHRLSLTSSIALFDDQYFGCFFRLMPDWQGIRSAPQRLRSLLDAKKPVCLWGISGRAVTLLSHLGLGDETVAYCVDIAPEKQGQHVPVTGQKILSPEQAVAAAPRMVIVANRNYANEIAKVLPDGTDILTINDIVG